MRTLAETTASAPERALLVGTDQPHMRLPVAESLAELERLANTAGLDVVDRVIQALKRPHAATLIGQGKVAEIHERVGLHRADVVVFDDALSPAQQRNLEKAFGKKVIDRSALILDIFAQRARSLEGKMQVELAQLQYLLPRLTRAWTHLSRQRGGGVGTRGPGETQLEVDRRRVRERIAMLRRRLEEVRRTRGLHRTTRAAVPFPTVALVGYTNAGKSTLMNALTEAGVLVEDKLFATLDPTVRRLRLPGGHTVLLADTVGFIHKLPHQLVEAFKSTLEEVRTADLLLHVIDATHPHWPEHAHVVDEVLAEIDASELPRLRVFNKIDALTGPSPGLPIDSDDTVRISARAAIGLETLLTTVEQRLSDNLERVQCDLPAHRGDIVAWARRAGRIVDEEYSDGRVRFTVLAPPKVAGQLRKAIAGSVE